MVDLTVNVETLTFKNPVLVGPLIVTEYPRMLEKCLAQGAGGVITPTYTTAREATFRPRPYVISPQALFPDLQDMFLTIAEFSAVPPKEALEKHIPQMRKLCDDAGVPLIASILATGDTDATVKLASDFAPKVDALELNTYYLDRSRALEIIGLVKKEVRIPLIARVDALTYDAQYISDLVRADVKSIGVHPKMPKGILIDTELEEPIGINWACNVMYGKYMLAISLATSASIIRTQPGMNLIAIEHVIEPEDIIQCLLIGCKATSIYFAVQRFGYKNLAKVIDGIRTWMEAKGYGEIEEFRGRAIRCVKDPFLADYPFKPIEELGAIYMPVVDMKLCKPKECIRCEEFCLHEVFDVIPEEARVKITDENCMGCGICVGLCPEGAVKLVNRCTEEVILERGTAKLYVERRPPVS